MQLETLDTGLGKLVQPLLELFLGKRAIGLAHLCPSYMNSQAEASAVGWVQPWLLNVKAIEEN